MMDGMIELQPLQVSFLVKPNVLGNKDVLLSICSSELSTIEKDLKEVICI